jgi:hypothetical protein
MEAEVKEQELAKLVLEELKHKATIKLHLLLDYHPQVAIRLHEVSKVSWNFMG